MAPQVGEVSVIFLMLLLKKGGAMLSSVLNNKRAIEVNIQIMRTFTKIREIPGTHKALRQKIEVMEKKYT